MENKEPKSKELKEIENEVCPLCNGTGEIVDDEWDDNTHRYQPTGTKQCSCKN